MLAKAGMEPRIRFRPIGEEIDGSFIHRGRVILLEAKWTQGPLPASSIYQFRGKVEGKLIGTIGVFISMSGFSADAVHALVAGKVINTCGVPELGHCSWPGLLRGSLILVDEAAEDGPALDPLPGEVSDRVVGPGRAELAAAMRSPAAVVGPRTGPGPAADAVR